MRSGGAAPAVPSLLDNPLRDWPNDDLLFSESQRGFIARRHPRALPILDWPELRALFAGHDPAASRFRRRSRRIGVLAALLGGAGLLIGALTPLILAMARGDGRIASMTGAVAALLALAGGIAAYGAVLRGRDKSRWLSHRFWTERMRQLHFQFIANNLPLAAEAMLGGASLKRWNRLREHSLDRFVHRFMEPLSEAVARMGDDLAEDQPWLEKAWEEPGPLPPPSAETEELFELLRHQRFGIQRRYTGLKLSAGFHSPRSRSGALRAAGDILTAISLIAAAAAGLMLVMGRDAASFAVIGATAIGGAMMAVVVTLRVLDEGLQLASETDRYEWYLAAVEALERRYSAADDAGKVALLREMERLSYQELRWFTVSFSRARFVI